jgi:hypothetical protein
MRKSTKILGALGASAIVLSTAGVAYAYWTTTGTGSGTATASTGGGAITLYSQPAAGLAPGTANAVAVVYKASSALTYSTKLQSITVGLLSVDSAHSTCAIGDFTASPPVLVTDPTVPANTPATAPVTVANGTLTLADTTADQSACKGAVITIPVTSS